MSLIETKQKRKKRSQNFDHKEMKTLTKLVASIDKRKWLSAAGKDAGTNEKKRKIWAQIVEVS